MAYLKLERQDDAVTTFRDIIARRPSDIMSHKARLELADVALIQGNGDEAVSLAETVIESVVDDNAARAQYIIGRRYFLEDNFQRAFEELMKVTILYKNYEEWATRAKLLIARSLAGLDKKDKALKTLREVLEAHPRDEFGDEARQIENELK